MSPYAARPLEGRLSEPAISSAGRHLELQESDWKMALRNSPTLASFHRDPIPLLVPVPMYVPSCYFHRYSTLSSNLLHRPLTPQGIPVRFEDMEEYARHHDWLTNILCFCSLEDGIPRPVSIFTASRLNSEHFGSVCIGCSNWRTGDNCSFFGTSLISHL